MNRLERTKGIIDCMIASMSDTAQQRDALVHLYGVSSLCVLLAQRRGLDAELSGISGLLHDIYRYKTGVDQYHSHSGAEMARVILKRMMCFSENEKKIILSAIYHHGDKAHVHDAYDEVLKDADTLQPFLVGDWRMPNMRASRLRNMARELNLPDLHGLEAYEPKPKRQENVDKRESLARIAEFLAQEHIKGERQSTQYMEVIRYWPEEEAFDELKNGWCAAFVYHCCQEAGFRLPIRLLNGPCRFAGVAAWNVWAREQGVNFFIKDDHDIVPKRGDIVLYRNIIPPENKPAEQKNIPIDHIGIVLSCDGKQFMVAEGNTNNENLSGILIRPLHSNVEGYIRIDNAYQYDGWKIDYKSGKERIVTFEEFVP